MHGLFKLLLVGFLIVFVVRYVQTMYTPPFVPQDSSFTLSPPAQAITGTLTQSTGTVEQLAREADEYQQATPGGIIRQGESVATKRGTAVMTLGDAGSITLGNASEISFVNLIPSALMLLQKSGTISYEVNSTQPFSIRALRALVTLNGDATLTITNTNTIFRVTKGTAKLALVDQGNTTKVWNIVEGQTARVTDDQTVSVR